MSEITHVTGRQIAAARALAGVSQAELASAARISLPTLRRMEASDGEASGLPNNVLAVVAALENVGAVFIANGQQAEGGPGVRLKAGFEPKIKLASDGPHHGAYQRYVGGAPLVDPEDKQG